MLVARRYYQTNNVLDTGITCQLSCSPVVGPLDVRDRYGCVCLVLREASHASGSSPAPLRSSFLTVRPSRVRADIRVVAVLSRANTH